MIITVNDENFRKIIDEARANRLSNENLSLFNADKLDWSLRKGSTFLMPLEYTWIKKVDQSDYNMSDYYSSSRKEKIRKAQRMSEKEGIYLNLVSPINDSAFQKFYNYYTAYFEQSGYDFLLNSDYLIGKDLDKLSLLEVYDSKGEYQGARFIAVSNNKLCCSFRTLNKDLIKIDGGIDNICEAFFYKMAFDLGLKKVSLGLDINIRGWQGRRVGLFLNKLKFGYKPNICKTRSLRWLDLKNFSQLDFDLILFVSQEMVNNRLVLSLNLLTGKPDVLREEDWQFLCKSLELVREYDRNFNLIRQN